MSDNNENFDKLTPAEFEARLPELIASGPGELLSDPRFSTFFENNPNCSALVRDLKAIADAASMLLRGEAPEEEADLPDFDNNDPLWGRIKGKLDEPVLDEAEDAPAVREPKLV